MSATDARPGPLLRATEAVLYAVAYAAGATVAAVAVGAVVGLAVGDVRVGWLLVEPLLFFGGFLLLGYAALKLRPPAPHKLPADRRERSPPSTTDEPAPDGDDENVVREATRATPETRTVRTHQTRLEAAVARLPPLRGRHLPPDDRLEPHAKQLLAAVLLVVASGVFRELLVG